MILLLLLSPLEWPPASGAAFGSMSLSEMWPPPSVSLSDNGVGIRGTPAPGLVVRRDRSAPISDRRKYLTAEDKRIGAKPTAPQSRISSGAQQSFGACVAGAGGGGAVVVLARCVGVGGSSHLLATSFCL